VTFLGVSGGVPPAPLPLVLPPHSGLSGVCSSPVYESWWPTSKPAEWVLHLDIPPGVVVESRDEYSVLVLALTDIPPYEGQKVSMPVFRSLTPANQAQFHLGTDLGGASSRLNVGIYNAGTSTATAVVEVRAICGGDLLSSTTVTIPADSVVQTSGITSGDASAGANQLYTVVTVSQPGLSYVANINESLDIPAPLLGLVPQVGLAVAASELF
jgi:hypothetical protein